MSIRFLGSALVIIGLYGVLWGKDREVSENEEEAEKVKQQQQQHKVKSESNEDIESRLPVAASGNGSTRPISP